MLNQNLSFKADEEILEWLETIEKAYKEKYAIDTRTKSNLIRTIIMREYFRESNKMD